jgi:two-component system OmpR family response regulator
MTVPATHQILADEPGGAPPGGPRVLLVEDDLDMSVDIEAELRLHGCAVDVAGDGAVAAMMLDRQVYSLLIIDRMLPGLDGLTIVEALRARRSTMPVLVLSALSAIDDRVRGLKAGGDDYLTKPFAFAELIARVEALLRRPTESRETRLRAGRLEIDLIERTATWGAAEIPLLPREFKLLAYLVRHEGQAVTRQMLLEEVWNYRSPSQANLVDVHVGRLRRKLEEASGAPLIHSIRAVGFTLRAPE